MVRTVLRKLTKEATQWVTLKTMVSRLKIASLITCPEVRQPERNKNLSGTVGLTLDRVFSILRADSL